MAEGNGSSGSSGGNGMLYFIVGALCVAVAVGGFLLFGGQTGPTQAAAPAATSAPTAPAAPARNNVDIKVEGPAKIEVPSRPDRR